jgi:hypothetical protein
VELGAMGTRVVFGAVAIEYIDFIFVYSDPTLAFRITAFAQVVSLVDSCGHLRCRLCSWAIRIGADIATRVHIPACLLAVSDGAISRTGSTGFRIWPYGRTKIDSSAINRVNHYGDRFGRPKNVLALPVRLEESLDFW